MEARNTDSFNLEVKSKIWIILGNLRKAVLCGDKSRIETNIMVETSSLLEHAMCQLSSTYCQHLLTYTIFLQSVWLKCSSYLAELIDNKIIDQLERQWSQIIVPNENKKCSICKWSICRCHNTELGGEISYGFDKNEELLLTDEKMESCVDPIELIFKSAKQHCKKCFIDHTPLKRWCNKVNRKNNTIRISTPIKDRANSNNKSYSIPSMYFCLSNDLVDYETVIGQLDGIYDELDISDNVNIPFCLGTVDCEDNVLFHLSNLFRGFSEIWRNFQTHPLCDHKRSSSSDKTYCTLCLVRSFSKRVNEVKTSGGKKSLKPMEIFSEIEEIIPSYDRMQSIESAFCEFIKKILENYYGFIPNLKMQTSTCISSNIFPPIIDCESVGSDVLLSLEDILNCCMNQKLNCKCDEECTIIDDSNLPLLVFKFKSGQRMIIDKKIKLFGQNFSYACHVEEIGNGHRSNFIWKSDIFGVEDNRNLSASTIVSSNVKLIVLSKQMHGNFKEVSQSLKYDLKALRVFSSRAAKFLNPDKYKISKERAKAYDKKRNISEERKESKRESDKRRDPIRNESEDRKQMKRESYHNVKSTKILQNYDTDTGFNMKCTCCLQYKGLDMGHPIDKLTEEEHELYLYLNDMTINKDQQYYICAYCYQGIRKKSMKKKDERPLFIVRDFPQSLENQLLEKCQFKDTIFSDKNRFGENCLSSQYILPNKLEQFLIKDILPFIRVTHTPRSRYFQVIFFVS